MQWTSRRAARPRRLPSGPRAWTAALLALGCSAQAPRSTSSVPTRPATSVDEVEQVAPPAPSRPRADVPAPPDGDRPGLALAAWHERHEAQLLEASSSGVERARAQLVVLGDSIADGWFNSRSFEKQWRRQRPLNLALPRDQTGQLLWRIDRGALEGLAPRVVIVLVGVFNLTAGFTPEETAAGIRAVLARVREQLPAAGVLVVSLLPAGAGAADPLRARISATNRELEALREPGRVVVADVGGMFIEADGTISPSVMHDVLLPTELGYQALTTALSLVTEQLIQAPPAN